MLNVFCFIDLVFWIVLKEFVYVFRLIMLLIWFKFDDFNVVGVKVIGREFFVCFYGVIFIINFFVIYVK